MAIRILSGENITGTITGIGTYTAGNSVKIFEAQRSGGAVKSDWSYHDANTTMSFGTSTLHPLSIKTNDTERIRVQNTGNIGINNNNPTEILDISDDDGDTNIRVYDSSANSEVGLKLQNDAKTWTLQNWGSGGDNLRLLNNAGNIVQLWDDNGNVMIGNANDPEKKLHIYTSTTDDTPQVLIQNGSSGDASLTFNVSGQSYVIGIDHDDSSKFKIAASGNLGTNDRVTVLSTGEVGIGTITPNEKLVIGTTGGAQNIEIGNSYIQSFNRSGSPGYASLNFYASSYDFNVSNATFAKNIIFTDGAAYSSAASIRQQSSALIFSGGSTGYYFNKSDNSTTHMFINSSGNVGIGLTNPSQKLEVTGNFKLNGTVVQEGTGNNLTFRYRTGNSSSYTGGNATCKFGRFYWTPAHWVTGAPVIKVTLHCKYYQGERREYIIKAGYQDTDPIINELQPSSTQQKITLLVGATTSAGYNYAGQPVYYVDLQWVQTAYIWGWAQVESQVAFLTSNPTSGWGGVVMDSAITQNNLAGLVTNYNSFFAGKVGVANPNPSAFNSLGSTAQIVIGDANAVSNITMYSSSSGYGSVAFADSNSSSSSSQYSGLIQYYHVDNSMQFYTTAVERMRITSAGNVGIGITTPQAKLQVNGAVNTFSAHFGGQNNSNGQFQGISLGYAEASNAAYRKVGIVTQTKGDGAARQDLHFLVDTVADSNSAGIADSKMHIQYNTGDVIIDNNLGIGTTSPSAKLDVSGSGALFMTRASAGLATYIENDGGYAALYMYQLGGGQKVKIHTNGTSFFNGGNVGIGTGSPSVPLQVHGQQKWYTTSVDGNELRGFFNPGGSGDDAELSVYKADGATEGVVWRGTGNSYIRIDSTSLKFINFYYGMSNVGQIVTGGTNVLYQSNSDYRLKENVVEMTGALDRVSELKPSRYNFISHPEEQVDGFMAHELQEVVPQAVSGQKDEMNEDGTPKYQGVDHSQIVPLLVGAIKELKAEIENLKSQK